MKSRACRSQQTAPLVVDELTRPLRLLSESAAAAEAARPARNGKAAPSANDLRKEADAATPVPRATPIVLRAPRPSVGDAPGSLLSLGFSDTVDLIECDLSCAIRAAVGYPLHPACVPSPTLVGRYLRALDDTSLVNMWSFMMHWRIEDSWRARNPALIWLDDKVVQVRRAAALCGGREVHLPLYAHADAGDSAAEAALHGAVQRCVERREPIAVKPRHGANSCYIYLWPAPHEVEELTITNSIKACLVASDSSWDSECWQLSQVPRGAIVQPMYAMTVPVREGGSPKNRPAPLELKVQVVFGEVVGGTLNTHPQCLWVTREGGIHLWEPGDLHAHGFTRCQSLERRYGHCLPQQLLETLQRSLRCDWAMIRRTSEELSRGAGLDELRVDWLLGDPRWGSRVGELTYMGAGSRLVQPVSVRVARAYAAAHLCRLGHVAVETEAHGGGFSDLWPSE